MKAIGKPIYFKKGGVEEEGVIEKVLLNDPQVRALCPRPELVDLFVGILVRLKNGEEKRLKIGDSTIDYVAFWKEEKYGNIKQMSRPLHIIMPMAGEGKSVLERRIN